jgi:RNA polymerase sigma-70 factor (ECF subfamily)
VSGLNPDHLAVVSALRKISAEQRLAIVLYHYGGLSVEEIAAETSSSPSSVKARLSRGRKALAPHLTEFAESLDTPPPRIALISEQPQTSRREI